MKMYDKNGNLTLVAKEIFNSGLERMRSGESAMNIAKDLQVQIKLVKYEGEYLADGRLSPTALALKNVGAIFYSINRNGFAFGGPKKVFDMHRPYIPGMVPPQLTKSVIVDTLVS